jgi:Matrixin
MNRRYPLAILTVALLVLASSQTTSGFATLGSKWANGSITMNLALGPGSGTMPDGATSYNQAFANAMNIWNGHIDLAKFAAVADSTRPNGDGDLINHVFFDDDYYGEQFGASTLAITTRWTLSDTQRVEADVVFNNRIQWSSYRGNLRSANGREQWDIQRVALHELGHALGLDHPDERGQSVTALMNSILGNMDALQADDIAGARSLYGAGGVVSNVTFPPRNEPNDFFQQLIGIYRDRLGASAVTTFVDPEGAVVWLSEYARYRVGVCDHSTAQTRVFAIIRDGVSIGVCAITPTGAIPFPPRNEGLQFMIALNDMYRDTLGRPSTTSFVDNEGAVVWVLEYFRYRLNGCTHGDATTRVFQQILGQGIQPVCSA